MTATFPFELDLPPKVSAVFRSTLEQFIAKTEVINASGFRIGQEGSGAAYELSASLVQFVEQPVDWRKVLQNGPFIQRKDGSKDSLATLVFMANYFQEYAIDARDDIGRMPFSATYQAKYGIEREDTCLKHFKAFLEEHHLGKWKDCPSRLFVSHDNDGLFRSFKQDGLFALRRGRLDWLLRIVFSEAMRKPRWFNMDRIMDINDAYDLKSTFFWLVEQGDVYLENRKLRNSDYSIDDPRIQRLMKRIESRGFEQGLHKSISSLGFKEEIAKLPFSCRANRNHFLRLRLPEHFQEMEESGLKLDFSVGFAEEFGLRNNYALPYRPYDLHQMKTLSVVYVPLMIMDTTNWTYKQYSMAEFRDKAVALIEEHDKNAVISILWHNKYFTDMKFDGYLDVYRTLLKLCRERGVAGISQQELINQYAS